MNAHLLGVRSAYVDGVWVDGDVVLRDGAIVEVGRLPAGGEGRAVPGFVDLQVNGFAGVSFTTCDSEGFERAALAMAARGTTSFLPTIPTTARRRYPSAMRVAGDAIRRPGPGARPLGIHLEGPFLSPKRRGAHELTDLVDPDPECLDELLRLGPVAMMTLAPELPGAGRLIDMLVERNVVVSAGHSDASTVEAHAAFDRGVTMVTHLWNAQRQITSREPGLAGAGLARRDVHVGIIADLVHLAAETLTLSVTAAGARAVAVSDASSVAGLAEGDHEVDGQLVTVRDGAVRLRDGTLAGSAAGLDCAVRNLAMCGLGLERAIDMVTSSPATAIGRRDIGRLGVGTRADVVVLADDLSIARVLVGGRDVGPSGSRTSSRRDDSGDDEMARR